jgi:hypothetical protein
MYGWMCDVFCHVCAVHDKVDAKVFAMYMFVSKASAHIDECLTRPHITRMLWFMYVFSY